MVKDLKILKVLKVKNRAELGGERGLETVRMVRYKKRHVPWMKGRHLFEETKRKMLGRKFSEETKNMLKL